MTPTLLFAAFAILLLGGVPIGVALGLAGTAAILLADQSVLAVPTNVYAGMAKYPLIALPMFVLVGSVFDRTGVALRLVRFATAAGRHIRIGYFVELLPKRGQRLAEMGAMALTVLCFGVLGWYG